MLAALVVQGLLRPLETLEAYRLADHLLGSEPGEGGGVGVPAPLSAQVRRMGTAMVAGRLPRRSSPAGTVTMVTKSIPT